MLALRRSAISLRSATRPLVAKPNLPNASRSLIPYPKRHLSSWTPLRHQAPYEQHMVNIVMATNVAVFGLWYVGDQRFMQEHFAVSLKGLLEFKLHTLLTSSFSHTDPFSLLGTLIGIHTFGNSLKVAVGAKTFLGLYIAGGVAGSLVQLALSVHRAREYNPFLRNRPFYDNYMAATVPGCVGVKGSVTAVVTVLALAFPRMQFYFFIAPMPLVAVGGAYLMFEVYRDQRAYGPFVGGAATGLLFYGRRLMR